MINTIVGDIRAQTTDNEPTLRNYKSHSFYINFILNALNITILLFLLLNDLINSYGVRVSTYSLNE